MPSHLPLLKTLFALQSLYIFLLGICTQLLFNLSSNDAEKQKETLSYSLSLSLSLSLSVCVYECFVSIPHIFLLLFCGLMKCAQ